MVIIMVRGNKPHRTTSPHLVKGRHETVKTETSDKTSAREFKYAREDFGELPVRLEHLTIYINFLGEEVEAANCLQMTAVEGLDRIELDASDLEIKSVEWLKGPEEKKGEPLAFEYTRENNKLAIKLPRRVASGQRFFVRTVTRCVPSEHILEGIYKDTTPQGAPQQYISQCQQWGFQRIMPIFDDCRAKCTMTTTIEADSRYTHLISNGNVDRASNPDGKPVVKPADPARQVITYRNPVPMAPYLFFVCAGTWDSVPHPSGRTVRLEYLVPPGSTEYARIPMEILKESVLWIEKKQGYEYPFDTYRTICMTKSNFGGMENLGNTTIVTDAALITEHTLDTTLLYAHAVIVHEFEHNQCGSDTTMETPFDVWLNEAYTVDVERQFMAEVFDPSFARLFQVDSIRAPLLGPLAIEDAGHFGRIVRDGFNDPEELIDGVTYVKAAEVIRMLRLIIGEAAFKAGKSLYFERYRGGNANTEEFFACFEEVSGVSLRQFKSGWLYRIGYPKLSARTEADGRRFRVKLRQELPQGMEPFCLPLSLALVDKKGRDMAGTKKIFTMKEEEEEIVYEELPAPPAFASMNRDSSFYGTFQHTNADTATLSMQARYDPNAYNRVDAMRKLTDLERVRLLKTPDSTISEEWLAVFGEFLRDRSLPTSLKAYFLRVEEQPVDRSFSAWYQELVAARERLMSAVNARYRDEMLLEFRRLHAKAPTGSSQKDGPKVGIEDRMLKNVLLELITIDDSRESHSLILDYFHTASTASERVAALTALNRSSEPSRRGVLEEVYKGWHKHLSGYANYLRVVSSGTREDVFEMIEVERRRGSFDVNQPTWCRALFLSMAANNKMVWTDRGIKWAADTVVSLAPVNATTASRLLNTFQHVKSLKPHLREEVTSALERIVRLISKEACATIHGQAEIYLRGKK